jgi:hypothetical protein
MHSGKRWTCIIFRRVSKTAKSDFQFRYICLSDRMEQLGSHWKDFHEIWHLSTFRNSVQKIKVSLKSDKNNGYFTWRPKYIFILSRSVLLRMRNVSDKSCRENQNTHYMFNNLFQISCRLWGNVKKYVGARQATDDNIIWSMRIGCWITKATNTYSEYVSTVTMVIRAPLNVILHLRCLCC